MGNGRNLKVARSPDPANPKKAPLRVNNHEQQPKRACGDKTHSNGGSPILISRGPGGKMTCDIQGAKCSNCPHR